MKFKITIILLLFTSLSFKAHDNSKSILVRQSQILQIEGYPGKVIDQCIEKRIMGQDVNMLAEPFKLKNETWCWQSEFWGKWMLSAVAAYKYTQSPVLLEKMNLAVTDLLATQQKDGHIGNYGPDTQLTGWDIWGRKYTMLGLIKYYEVSGNKKALKAATRVADKLITQVGPGKTNIVMTGFYRGMASSSVLEPIVYLYHHTGNQKYMDFAEYIVAQWETEEGPKLISKALNNVPVKERFPKPKKWWSWENGQKAYEMMSCYDGLLELYKITKNSEYLEAVTKTVDDIIKTEINIAGSGSAFECWYGTVENQTQPTYHTMETCVTVTWMKLCNSLLELTGDPKYADQIEISFFNALMASLKSDASEIAKYSPLEGLRHAGEDQCNMPINCCNANGPRGFAMMPGFGITSYDNEVFINYYGDSEAELSLGKNQHIKFQQTGAYPKSGQILLEVNPEIALEFIVNLRIPAWSKETVVDVNGEEVGEVKPGEYLQISKTWVSGDKITVQLDMSGRLHENHGHQAITRGPIVLARYSVFNDGFVDEAAVIQNDKGIVELTPVEVSGEEIWMGFTALCKTGTDLEGTGGSFRKITLCDFASAGNTWDPATRYKVWLPETLNVMEAEYERY